MSRLPADCFQCRPAIGPLRIAVLAAFAATLAASAAPSPARARQLGSSGRVVMLDGYWEPEVPRANDGGETADPRVRMRMSLATLPDGRGVRIFAVTAARAYFDADSSVDPFRPAGIRPAFNLRGREEVLARMLAVAPGEPMTVVASWTDRSADLLVADVRLANASEEGIPDAR